MVGKHPWLHYRGGRYYLRAKVPVDLVEIVGKREVKHALGTSDLREAKRPIHDAAAKVEKEFGQARRRLAAIQVDAAATLIEAEHRRNLKKIERENSEQRRRATVKAIMTVKEDIEKVLLGATRALKGE